MHTYVYFMYIYVYFIELIKEIVKSTIVLTLSIILALSLLFIIGCTGDSDDPIIDMRDEIPREDNDHLILPR